MNENNLKFLELMDKKDFFTSDKLIEVIKNQLINYLDYIVSFIEKINNKSVTNFTNLSNLVYLLSKNLDFYAEQAEDRNYIRELIIKFFILLENYSSNFNNQYNLISLSHLSLLKATCQITEALELFL